MCRCLDSEGKHLFMPIFGIAKFASNYGWLLFKELSQHCACELLQSGRGQQTCVKTYLQIPTLSEEKHDLLLTLLLLNIQNKSTFLGHLSHWVKQMIPSATNRVDLLTQCSLNDKHNVVTYCKVSVLTAHSKNALTQNMSTVLNNQLRPWLTATKSIVHHRYWSNHMRYVKACSHMQMSWFTVNRGRYYAKWVQRKLSQDVAPQPLLIARE